MLGAGKNPLPQFLSPIPGCVGEGGRGGGGEERELAIIYYERKKKWGPMCQRSLIFCFVFGSF